MAREEPHEDALRGLSLEEAIGYWDAVLRSPDCERADILSFRDWCSEDPAHATSFENAQTLISNLERVAKRPEIQSMREAALAIDLREEKRGAGTALGLRSGPFARLAFAAAALVIAVGGVGYYISQSLPFGPADSGGLIAGKEPIPQRFSTALGERSTVTLADGSEVTLNTDTEMSVDFSSGERSIKLIKGEAFFDVFENPERPFVVTAADKRVTALGTAFDVRYIDNTIRVMLFEGRVEVARDADRPDAGETLSEPLAQLEPGQQSLSVLGPLNMTTISEADIEKEKMWRFGRIFFEDATLSDAIAEMNRYSATKIIVEGETLSEQRISGTFRTGRQDIFVDALATYFPIEIENAPDQNVIKLSQSALQ